MRPRATMRCTRGRAPSTTPARSSARRRRPTCPVMGWYLAFGAVIVGVAVIALRARSGSARQRQLLRLCADAGLACAMLDPFDDTTLLPFRLFGWGSAHGVENVV